jgi:hypothetical protein
MSSPLGGASSDSPSLQALGASSDPDLELDAIELEPAADPAAAAEERAPAVSEPGPAGVRATGVRAAVLGSLVAGAQQFVSQLTGTVGRAALQAGLLVWAGHAWRQTPATQGGEVPSSGNSTGGDTSGSDDSGAGSVDAGAGNHSTLSNSSASGGDWPNQNHSTFSNETIWGNHTLIGNHTFLGNDTETGNPPNLTWLGQPGLNTTFTRLARLDSLDLSPDLSPERSPDFSVEPARALADLVAGTQAGLAPSSASLPVPQALPGDAFTGAALPGYDFSAATLAGPVALAGAMVAVSILVTACRVYELGRGAVSALTGRCRRPETAGQARLGRALTGTLGLVATATPVLIGLTRDSARAHGPQERQMLAVWLLINLAGRTCQHLLRDATTQLTRPHMPMLRYQAPLGSSRVPHDSLEDFAPADVGSPAFRALHLDRRAMATRMALTFMSYWAGIYFCLHHVMPAIRHAGGFPDSVTLRDQVHHGHSFGHVFHANVPGLLTSALIEGLDSLTSSLSTSVATGTRGARIELVPGRRSTTVARDFLDHFSVRVFNAFICVDPERAGNALRGIDRDTEPGMFLQGFALGLTDIRGFVVQFGQHGRALALAAAQAAEPASQSEALPAVSMRVDPIIIDESGAPRAPDPRLLR